jgi:transaldolase
MWDLGVGVLADSGDCADLIRWLAHPGIAGATTNPTLLRRSGGTVDDLLATVAPYLAGRPISVYPVASSHEDVLFRAHRLRCGYPNVFIKVPVVDRDGVPNEGLLEKLAADGQRLNVTAVHDCAQARVAEQATRAAPGRVVSVFAGRLADSGRDPTVAVAAICQALAGCRDLQVMWASSRQVFDAVLARRAGCHLITVPTSILGRADLWGHDTGTMARLAVRQFEEAAGGSR